MRLIAVSIIICTRNRADSLRETLQSIGRCEIPADLPSELLVIDNGSTDQTRDVVAGAGLKNMPVRYVLEARKGKGYAYNTGLAEARGQVFLFTDDDVRVPANWVVGMSGPIINSDADAVAGGVGMPEDRATHPAVAVAPFWFASTDDMNTESPDRMVGANMAIGRQIFKKVPAFDVELGPGAMGFNDETLFSRQLLAAGYRIKSAFGVQVSHHFDLSRLNRAGLLNTANRMGRCDAYVQYHWSHSEHAYGPSARLRLWMSLWRQRLTHLSEWLDARTILRREVFLMMDLGYASQLAIERKRPRNYERNGLRKLRGALPDCVASQRSEDSTGGANLVLPGNCA